MPVTVTDDEAAFLINVMMTPGVAYPLAGGVADAAVALRNKLREPEQDKLNAAVDAAIAPLNLDAAAT